VAADGHEAIAAARAHHYAAILMDCRMPGMDGFDATRAIRRDEQDGDRIPIIAVTADVIGDVRSACLAAGMDDYVSKPLDQGDLAVILARHVRRAPGGDLTPRRMVAAGAATVVAKLAEFDRTTPGLGQRIATLFVEDSETRIAAIVAALADADAATVAELAHALRGAAANVAAADMASAGSALEAHALAGRLAAAHASLDALRSAFEQARRSLHSAGMADAA
jgi:CheY-like chemotaxis protein/HPt (histidine-containing phosphotransfer) domain-containing protein